MTQWAMTRMFVKMFTLFSQSVYYRVLKSWPESWPT